MQSALHSTDLAIGAAFGSALNRQSPSATERRQGATVTIDATIEGTS